MTLSPVPGAALELDMDTGFWVTRAEQALTTGNTRLAETYMRRALTEEEEHHGETDQG